MLIAVWRARQNNFHPRHWWYPYLVWEKNIASEDQPAGVRQKNLPARQKKMASAEANNYQERLVFAIKELLGAFKAGQCQDHRQRRNNIDAGRRRDFRGWGPAQTGEHGNRQCLDGDR